MWEQPYIPPQLLELSRLRLAQMHGADEELKVRYPLAQKAGLKDEKIAKLRKKFTGLLKD